MKSSLAAFSAAALLGLAAAQPARCEPPAAQPERPLTTLPYTPSLDPSFMDRSADPCVDFYTYSCGKWSAKNPIPGDQSRWSVYWKLDLENHQFLWGMLEEASRPDPGRDANTRKIGDYFAACMDTAALDKAGAAPLRADLDAIAALKSGAGLAALLGRLQPTADPGTYFFGFGSGQDYESSTQVIGFASGGGLGLPDRDYYLNDDAKSKETRERYLVFVRHLFELLGDKDAAQESAAVMRVETALAKASLSPVEMRDPHKLDHRMDRAGLQKLTPSFHWNDYLKAIGQPDLNVFNVTEPELYREFDRLIAAGNLNDLRAYLRLHLAAAKAPFLSAPFVRADFDFYEAYLQGAKEMPPRWKTCVRLVDRDLGEALGEVFVRKIFPPDTKAGAQEMLTRIRAVMERRLKELPWMSEETKQRALAKLHAMRDKIGYPEHWRDYSALEVKRDDFAGNVSRAHVFEMRRELAKIGKPVDRGEWGLTPPTVNAYYDVFMNDINFPAGVLLPPLYDPKLDLAPSYGDTGGTIGHELTHGFDDEGRQFDAQGTLKDWWTPKDDAEFRQRVQCVADQYAQYTVVDDIKINSKLTLGEDVADLGGTILAYYAWKDATQGQTLEPRDGLTPDQRFFVGFAQWACGEDRPESLRLMARVNPHSPHQARINGVMVNMPEFAAAFSCKPGQPMVKEPDKVCRIW
ncbi:MAG TPA: M13 family metallopeptidase [Thermoanaerobaculia bacterium]